ncbi:putative sulfate exporter family transporter [Microtetraspora sp. AC03309]|nr:putative sulfate exporter family transporter [Microtetraspora sp. AC03309]
MVTTDTVAPAASRNDLAARAAALIPGLLLLAAIGYAGKLAETGVKQLAESTGWSLPNIEYVLWAILLGLIITNTVGVHRIFRPGIATYEFWLKLGIVLLGARFLLGDVLKLGGVSLALVVIELFVAIGVVVLIGRWFKLGPKLISLLAIGSSICGVSAIIAGKGAIDADDEDASFAIAAILALGAFGLFAYPAIAHLIGMSAHEFGLWAGLAVDNTAEATAAGALYSDEAAKVAVLAKSTRNATIGFVVLGFALFWAARGQARAVGSRTRFLWAKFPKFVLGFLAVSVLATAGLIAKADLTSLGNLSRWAFLLTFAGVGLSTDFRAIRRQGLRPFAVGALAEVTVTVVTLGLVVAASAWIGL